MEEKIQAPEDIEEECKMLSSAHCQSQCYHGLALVMVACIKKAQPWASSQSIINQGGAQESMLSYWLHAHIWKTLYLVIAW